MKEYDCLPHDLIIAKINAWVSSLDSSRLINHLSNRQKNNNNWRESLFGVPEGYYMRLIFSITLHKFASYADDKAPLLLDEIYF